MTNYKFDFNEDLYSSPYLDFDDKDPLYEWWSIEGAEKISELSRQLRTFLNFKANIIYARFSESTSSVNFSKNDMFNKLKDDMTNSVLELIRLLKEIGIKSNDISEKIQDLIERSKINPQFSTLDAIKKIKTINYNIWSYVHALSELDLHKNSKFFEIVINASSILCQVSAPLYIPFESFYNELKTDYLLLDEELLNIHKIYHNIKLSPNRMKIGVKITK